MKSIPDRLSFGIQPGQAISRRVAAPRDGAASERGGDRAAGLPSQQSTRNFRADYLLIVAGDAAFAAQLSEQLAAVGLTTLRASDPLSAKRLLAQRPAPVVIDLRHAGLPISGAAQTKT